MRKIAFGFLGSTLDASGGYGAKRHTVWRPTIALAQDPDLAIDQIELWYSPEFERLALQVKNDIEAAPRRVKVNLRLSQIADPWNFEEVYGFLYDFANSYRFQSEEEEYLVHLTTGTHVAQICLFLLTESRHFPARFVQTNPRARGSEGKNVIIDLDLSRYDKIAQRFEVRRQSDLTMLKTGIDTGNAHFNQLIAEIELVARSSTEPLLLMGPSGAGKSHLAKQMYLLKKSHYGLSGDFVDVNCATIRGDQAMSTLFGHVKGSFTGALTAREGLLKRADHGLLFLDEVGELGLDEQGMLLRALEEKSFFPLGGDREIQSDFQIICGTNRDLRAQVRRGEFREDLFYRICTWSFTLPGLADRREDIEPNLEFELKKFEARSGRRITFSAEAKQQYLDFAHSAASRWQGNFRDLNSSVIRLATLSEQGRINTSTVTDEIARLQRQWEQLPEPLAPELSKDDEIIAAVGVTPEHIDPFDRVQLAHVIRTIQNASSLADAGRELFSVSRTRRTKVNDSDRIRKYLARFGLTAQQLLAR